MTTFREHDRVRFVDTSNRWGRGDAPAAGTVDTVTHLVSVAATLHLAEHGGPWNRDRFELVEHAVAVDKDGKPLYVGDRVRRLPDGKKKGYEAVVHVQPERPMISGVRLLRNAGTDAQRLVMPPSRLIELVARRADGPTREELERMEPGDFWAPGVGVIKMSAPVEDPLTKAVDTFSKTWAEHQKAERDRIAGAVEGLTKALQKVIDAARPVEIKIPAPPAGPVGYAGVGGDNPKKGRAVIGYDPATGYAIVGHRGADGLIYIEPNPQHVGTEWLRNWNGELPTWDKVRADMQVRVFVEATGEIFTALVTKGEVQATGLYVHGIPTTHPSVRKGWKLLSLSPEKPTAEGSILAPINTADRSRAFLVDGKWWYDPAGPNAILPQESGFANDPTGWRVIWDAAEDSPLTGKEA